MRYEFNKIEEKWQKYWSDHQTFKTENNSDKPISRNPDAQSTHNSDKFNAAAPVFRELAGIDFRAATAGDAGAHEPVTKRDRY